MQVAMGHVMMGVISWVLGPTMSKQLLYIYCSALSYCYKALSSFTESKPQQNSARLLYAT